MVTSFFYIWYNTIMKINSYKKIKNNCYQISFKEDQEGIILYDDIILKYNLLLRKELNSEELKEILKENDILSCYYKAIKYITNRSRCKKEIREYLKRNKFSDMYIQKALELLENKKLINEEIFLKSFINDQINLTNNGPKKITKKLLALEFNEEQIEKYILEIPEKVWLDKLKKIITKKINTNKKDGISKLKERLIYNCMNEGYPKEKIMDVLETIELPENRDALAKETLKLYQKLALKYEEPELSYQVKGRLVNKGFLYNDINEVLEDIKKSS